jgi:hypothetical protein
MIRSTFSLPTSQTYFVNIPFVVLPRFLEAFSFPYLYTTSFLACMANEGLASQLAFCFIRIEEKIPYHKLLSCVFSVQNTNTFLDTSLYCLTAFPAWLLSTLWLSCRRTICGPNLVFVPIHHGASTRSAQAAQRHVITRPQPPSQLAPRSKVLYISMHR